MSTDTPNSKPDGESFVEKGGFQRTLRANAIKYVVILAGLVLLPFLLTSTGNTYWLTLLIELFVFGIAVLSFDLLFGYTGLLSFGHALFFGLGAYTVAIVARDTSLSFYGAIPVTLVVIPIVSLIIGAIALRLTGVYFAILMLAFGQLGYQTILQFTDLTGGINGISGITIAPIAGIDVTSNYAAYFITLVVLILTYAFLKRVTNSPFGRVLDGLNQNPERMEMLGINVYLHKLAAFTLAGTLGGLAGLLYPLYLNFIDPSLANWTTTGDILMMTLIGGLGTLWGPILGAGFYIFIQGFLESFTDQWRIILGAVFVVFVLLFPAGIAGLLKGETDVWGRLETIRSELRNDGGGQDE